MIQSQFGHKGTFLKITNTDTQCALLAPDLNPVISIVTLIPPGAVTHTYTSKVTGSQRMTAYRKSPNDWVTGSHRVIGIRRGSNT